MQMRSNELTPEALGGLTFDQYMRRNQIIYSHVDNMKRGIELIKSEKVMRNDEGEQELVYIFEMLCSNPEVYEQYAPMFLSYRPAKLVSPKEDKLPVGNFYRSE